MSSLDEAEDTWAAEKAREAAEARRKRILEQADARLGLVEGTFSNKNAAATGTTNTDDEGGASSTKSKLAAMRRRRFKKTSAVGTAVADAAATTDADTDTVEQASVSASIPKEEYEKVKSPEDEDINELVTPETKSAKADEEKQAEPEINEAAAAEKEDEVIAPGETKKKYMGVAKMRRRMIKERQQNQDQEGAMFNTATCTDTDADPAAKAKKIKNKKHRPVAATLPILMHVVTVLLLFMAGLDVGLQQSAVDYYDGALLQVHSELAPRKLGGLQRIMSYTTIGALIASKEADADAAKPKPKPSIAQPEWQAALEQEEAADEFADLHATNNEGEKKHSNLDPLFQLDLEKLTEGTGLYFFVARGAVRMHQLNLAIFYYGPRSFFQALAAFFLSLSRSPPILCLAAIVLRQFVGKFILGAKLPAKIEDETQHKDVMSMVKNFVVNFVLAAFPTAATLYDVWTHLRADMYVLLCGLFVGLAWSHNSRAGSPYGSSGGSSITSSDAVVPHEVVDGIADEL